MNLYLVLFVEYYDPNLRVPIQILQVCAHSILVKSPNSTSNHLTSDHR
uniref:Uncharacterized protein n=1 Tax=Rhizophora mucronata TaxID=61149 RepID=A0A2P2NQJ7_RHIMU